MELNVKKDEQYVDGRDKWTVHYITNNDTSVNPGDYTEVVQVSKNGKVVGQTTWRKDRNGKDRTEPWIEGDPQLPSTARKLSK